MNIDTQQIGKKKIDCICIPLENTQVCDVDFTYQGKASHIKGKQYSIFLTLLKLKHPYTVYYIIVNQSS